MLFLFVPRDSIGNHSGAVAKTHHREPAGKNACESPYETRTRQSDVPRSGGYPGSSSPVIPSLFTPLPSPSLPVRPRTPRLINSYLISEARQPGSRFSSCARAVSGGRISRSLRRYTVGPRHIAYY